MRRTTATLTLLALLAAPLAAGAPQATLDLPDGPASTDICHGPRVSQEICATVVGTVFGAAYQAAAIVDRALCSLGQCQGFATFVVRTIEGKA